MIDLGKLLVQWIFLIFLQFTPVEDLELGRKIVFRSEQTEYMFMHMEIWMEERMGENRFLFKVDQKGLHSIEKEIFSFAVYDVVVEVNENERHLQSMKRWDDMLFPEEGSAGSSIVVLPLDDNGLNFMFEGIHCCPLLESFSRESEYLEGESIVYVYGEPKNSVQIKVVYNPGFELVESIYLGLLELEERMRLWVIE